MPIILTPKFHLTILGIFPVPEQQFPEFFRKYHLVFNRVHISFVVMMLMGYVSSVLIFLFQKASTVYEYSEGALFSSVTIFRATLYFLLISKKSNLSSLMDELAEIVDNSKQSV